MLGELEPRLLLQSCSYSLLLAPSSCSIVVELRAYTHKASMSPWAEPSAGQLLRTCHSKQLEISFSPTIPRSCVLPLTKEISLRSKTVNNRLDCETMHLRGAGLSSLPLPFHSYSPCPSCRLCHLFLISLWYLQTPLQTIIYVMGRVILK